jgi:peptide deformylase
MSTRPIRQIGDPVLRERAREVAADRIGSPAVQSLIDDLVDTMRDADGAGLAANQVGELERIVVMEVAGNNRRYPYKPPIPLTVAINPIIEPFTGPGGGPELIEINEGCLSVPLRGLVQRHLAVRVRYLDRNGLAHDEVKRGLTAGTWQHECDHLDGALLVDRADPLTLATWDEYRAHHHEAFVQRALDLVARIGS